ncbi:MAG: bifunctional precorrin-2 dehydrogenase/sirohydrochlorin ferrochelatase [Acidobacteria bacterium]|nr:bifunctional precorrin-2 dehydrogenase/sirohydrochlorin ferrochelatase [Acidobacteriota bacterium]
MRRKGSVQQRRYYPIFLDLCSRKVVVIGGGPVAERKVRSLLAAGARVTVVSPRATAGLERLAAAGKVRWLARGYRRSDLSGAVLAFSATDRPEVERQVAADAAKRGIPVNCAGAPEFGSFLVPAQVKRGRLQIAVSTGGTSPVLAHKLAQELGKWVGPEYSDWTRLLAQWRPRIVKSVPPAERSQLLEQLTGDRIYRLLRQGRKREAAQAAKRLLQRWEIGTPRRPSKKKAPDSKPLSRRS